MELFAEAYTVPENVDQSGRLPPNVIPSELNTRLAKLYGLTREFVNMALTLTRKQFQIPPYFVGHESEIEARKKTAKGHMLEIHAEINGAAGQDFYPVPQELLDAFAYLSLPWPPVALDPEGGQDQQ